MLRCTFRLHARDYRYQNSATPEVMDQVPHVNATIGFEGLGRRLGIPSKSLHRMLSPNGNPSSRNFFAIIGALTSETVLTLSVAAGRPGSRRRVRRWK